MAALLSAGCSAAPTGLFAPIGPSHLGAAPAVAPVADAPAATPRVSAGKVLSAIVFERVTGLEVDPARLVER